MKKKMLLTILFVMLMLAVSLVVAMLSVTALNHEDVPISSGYGDFIVPCSTEGGTIQEDFPTVTMGDMNLENPSPMLPSAVTVTNANDFVDGV